MLLTVHLQDLFHRTILPIALLLVLPGVRLGLLLPTMLQLIEFAVHDLASCMVPKPGGKGLAGPMQFAAHGIRRLSCERRHVLIAQSRISYQE